VNEPGAAFRVIEHAQNTGKGARFAPALRPPRATSWYSKTQTSNTIHATGAGSRMLSMARASMVNHTGHCSITTIREIV
jgi:hypothetical protein